MFFFALTHTQYTHCGFFFFSHNILLFTIFTLRQRLFSFLHFTTWIKASQFFPWFVTLQKLCREDPNLVVSLLGVLPKQKSHLILLVSCPILLFFFSSHTIKIFAKMSIYKTSNQIPWYKKNVLLLWQEIEFSSISRNSISFHTKEIKENNQIQFFLLQ